MKLVATSHGSLFHLQSDPSKNKPSEKNRENFMIWAKNKNCIVGARVGV